MSHPGVLGRFFAWNTRCSKALEARFGWLSDKPLWEQFHGAVIDTVQSVTPGSVVVDLGGGRRCVWAHACPAGVQLVAVDIDQDELDANPDVGDRRQGDVATRLPLDDGEAQVIVSRALLEHVDGVPQAVAEMARVLGPGGRALHLVPARYSLFGLAARLGPFGVLKRLVHLAVPAAPGQVEFPVYYDHCYASALEQLFRDAGFSAVRLSLSYAQSGYFYALTPLYVLVAAYQGLLRRLGIRNLAAYVFVDATR